MKETLEQSLKFRQWKETLEKNNLTVVQVTPLHLVHKPNGELLFALVNIDAHDKNKEKILPVALLRGHFVSVLTCFTEQESGTRYLLLVKQYRVSTGEISYEHPAGMCDSETDPYKVAVKEVSEETGLTITQDQLVLLNNQMFYTSPGLLDEGGYFFYCELTLPKAEIDTFRDKTAGALGEHEFIQTHIATLEEAPKLMTNIPALLNYYLYLQTKK